MYQPDTGENGIPGRPNMFDRVRPFIRNYKRLGEGALRHAPRFYSELLSLGCASEVECY